MNCADWKSRARHHRRPIHGPRRCPGRVSRALADTTQLDNALLNLVINSRDAMPDGGTITIRAENVTLEDHRARDLDIAPGRYVAIEVTDSGMGMSPEVLAHAAEPFFTTKDIGKGTGLGLSMVHGFVRQSGGAMEIVSALGKGTTIRLLLPTTTEIADQQPVKARPRLVGVRNVTVLVVEDEPDVLGTAAAMLRSLGYGVIEAADGPAALAALQSRPRRCAVYRRDPAQGHVGPRPRPRGTGASAGAESHLHLGLQRERDCP